jgi:hypothetical protein
MCSGGLGLAVALFNLAFVLLGDRLGAGGGAGPAPPADPAGRMGFQIGQAAGAIVPVFWGIVVLSAAIMMFRLQTYGYAMTGAIVAMLPCNLCCPLGLAFGIWAVIVLNQQQVKDAFR